MILKNLVLENIRSYTNAELTFPEGSLLLSGDIGSGKSTILLAIDFALFGIQKNLPGGSLLRHGKNSGSVELTFDIDGREVTIRRTLKRKGDSVRQDTGFIILGGAKKELTAVEAKSFIINLLGYPEEAVTKDRSLIYRYTVYTPQEQMQAILRGDKDERLGIMRRIFGIDKYKRIQENVEVFAKDLRGRIREISALLGDLEDKRKALSELGKEKQSIQEHINQLNTLLKNETEKIIKADKELSQLQKQMEQSQKKREEYSALRSEFDSMKERFEAGKSGLSDLDSKIVALEKRLEEFKDLKPPSELNPEKLKKGIVEKEDRRRKVIAEISSLSKEISSLSEILEKGTCGTCRQKVADPAVFRSGIEKKKAEAGRLKEEDEKLSSDVEKGRKMLDMLQVFFMKSNEFNILKERKADLLESKKRYDLESKQLKAKMSPLYGKLKTLVEELKEEGKLSDSLREKQKELDSIKRMATDTEKGIAVQKQRSADNDKRISELESEIKKREEERKRMEELRSVEGWLSEFFVNLMGTIEKHVMANIQYEFNSFFQKWFSMLVSDENLQVSIDDEFTPVVEQNGFETDYSFLSGGERTAISLAYRLALNKVINELIEKIKTKDLLILDEPTDGFSAEQMDSVRDVLAELAIKQTVIVSHEPKIDSFVDNTYRFVKDDNISRVEVNFN